MTARTNVEILTDHLVLSAENRWPVKTSDMAAGILADPQRHVDALVEVGMLRRITCFEHTETGALSVPGYAVVLTEPPHVHDWCWMNGTYVACMVPGCPRGTYVAHGVPESEWPKYEGEVPE